MITNRSSYIFSSITASVDSKVVFEKLNLGGEVQEDVGRLHVPMDARFVVNDGQHRRAAIEEALRDQPDLGDETISVVFFIDIGLKLSQQMFADLNKHAVRPTRSLGILYDHRDLLSNLAKELVEKTNVFRNLTEMEKTTISNRSTKLFTLSGIYQGTLSLLRKPQKTAEIAKEEKQIALDYWEAVCNNMKDWRLAAEKAISTYELRRDYIHAHALALHVIGRVGAALLSTSGKDYKKELKKLGKIDWARKNTALWEGRAMIGGKISKSHNCVILTTNLLKNEFGLELTPEEKEVEEVFFRNA
jgi:DNA sulfur modification protein DndB